MREPITQLRSRSARGDGACRPSRPELLLPGPRRSEVILIFAGWTVFGLLSASQRYMLMGLRGSPVSVREVILVSLSEALLWSLTTIAVFWVARRFPLRADRLAVTAVAHVMAAVALASARSMAVFALARYTSVLPARPVGFVFLSQFHHYFLHYWLLLGIAWAVIYYAQYREREATAKRLEAGLTEARLQALKMQIHPHFLFNTLNAISALVPPEAPAARRMIARLGDLLRISLEHEEIQEVTLAEELEFLEPYLEIEQARLGDRLRLEFDVSPPAKLAKVPHLILQPIVENAVRHGIAPHSAAGLIRVDADVHGDDLVLTISNTGREGAPGPSRGGSGRGLANVRARLEALYGADSHLRAGPSPGGGWRVEIRIPAAGPRQPSPLLPDPA